MSQHKKLRDTAKTVDETLQKWYATCPYNGLEEHFTDEQHEEFVCSVAEAIRDDNADQQLEEARDHD